MYAPIRAAANVVLSSGNDVAAASKVIPTNDEPNPVCTEIAPARSASTTPAIKINTLKPNACIISRRVDTSASTSFPNATLSDSSVFSGRSIGAQESLSSKRRNSAITSG